MNNLWEKIRADSGPGGRSVLGTGGTSAVRAKSPAKFYSLMAATTLLALVASYLTATDSFGSGALVLVLFTTIFLIQSVVIHSFREGILVAVTNALGLLIFFYDQHLGYFFLTFAVVSLFFLWAVARGRRSVDNMLKIKFSQVVRPVVGIALAGITVFVSFVFFSKGDALLGVGNINRTIDVAVTPLINGYIKDFSSAMNTETALRNWARGQLSENPGFTALSQSQQELAIRQYTQELTAYIEGRTNFTLDMEASVGENVQRFVSAKAGELGPENQYLKAIFFVALLILLVKSIELVLYIPLGILAFILYELMIAFGFLVVQLEPRSKEVINMA